MRRSLAILFSACVLLAACADSSWAVQYTIQDLGTLPGGRWSWANDINSSGQVVGWSDTSSPGNRAVLWQNDTVVELAVLPGYTASSFASAINNSGQIVGAAFSDHYSRAVLWQNGIATELGGLPGCVSGVAWDINDSGQIVGEVYTSDGVHHAVVWQNGIATELAMGGAGLAYPNAINSIGEIAGSTSQSGQSHAFLWENGTATDLGVRVGGRSSWAYGINIWGRVVGTADGYGGYMNSGTHAYLWPEDGSMGIDLGTLGGTESRASAINDSGQIVGHAKMSNEASHACLWEDRVPIDLGTLPGYASSDASAINNSGQIVGLASTSSGADIRACLWQPVPEPSSLLALLCGAGGLLWFRKRG